MVTKTNVFSILFLASLFTGCIVERDLSDQYEFSTDPNKIVLHGFLEPKKGFDVRVTRTIQRGETINLKEEENILKVISSYVKNSLGEIVDELEYHPLSKTHRSTQPEVYIPGEPYSLYVAAEGYEPVVARDVTIPTNTLDITLTSYIQKELLHPDTLMNFDLHIRREQKSDQDYYYLLNPVTTFYADSSLHPIYFPFKENTPDHCRQLSGSYLEYPFLVFGTTCQSGKDFEQTLALDYYYWDHSAEFSFDSLHMEYGAVQNTLYEYYQHFLAANIYIQEPTITKSWVEGGYGVVAGRTYYRSDLF